MLAGGAAAWIFAAMWLVCSGTASKMMADQGSIAYARSAVHCEFMARTRSTSSAGNVCVHKKGVLCCVVGV